MGWGLAVAIVPAVADAHLIATGMGPLCDGVAHFGVSPQDYLPVLVLGLFAGLNGLPGARLTMYALTGAWLVGGIAAQFCTLGPLAVPTALLLVLLGGLLAWNPTTPVWVVTTLGAVIGLVRGLDDLRGTAADFPIALVLGSICGCVLVLYALSVSVTLPLKKPWMVVAVRVGGSWMAAIGLLLAGWIFRYGSQVY
jgi:hypothetical protein